MIKCGIRFERLSLEQCVYGRRESRRDATLAQRKRCPEAAAYLARNWRFESSFLQRGVMQTIGSSAATDLPNICCMGSSIMSGAGTAVVIQTGAELAGC